jgi:hypothetical protein
MRPQRRKLTRRRFRRIGPSDAVEAAPEAAPAPPRPMRCMCGKILEIAADDHGRRKSCASCRRRFEVQIAYNLTSGRNDISIHYLTDKNERSGETCVIGGSTTSFGTTDDGESLPSPEMPLQPEPPDEALHKCSCDVLLIVEKKHYESRVRCPDCGARWMVAMLFDPMENSFSLQTFSLADNPSGKTQILRRI